MIDQEILTSQPLRIAPTERPADPLDALLCKSNDDRRTRVSELSAQRTQVSAQVDMSSRVDNWDVR